MTQPEALRLTQVAPYLEGGERGQWIVAAVTELRRLHEVNQELLAALEKLARSIIGHPDDPHSQHIAAIIAKAEGAKK